MVSSTTTPSCIRSWTTVETVVRERPVDLAIEAWDKEPASFKEPITRSRFRIRSSCKPEGAVDGILTMAQRHQLSDNTTTTRKLGNREPEGPDYGARLVRLT